MYKNINLNIIYNIILISNSNFLFKVLLIIMHVMCVYTFKCTFERDHLTTPPHYPTSRPHLNLTSTPLQPIIEMANTTL